MSKLGCKFTIAVHPGSYSRVKDHKNLSGALKALNALSLNLFDKGCTYVQIENQKGQRTSYFFDARAGRGKALAKAGVVYLSMVAAMIVGDNTDNKLLKQVSFPGMLLLPGIAMLTGRGVVKRKGKTLEGGEYAVSYDIDDRQYASLKAELADLSRKNAHGIYSLPVSNCATFAVSFAKAHDFSIPHPPWPTPNRMGLHIAAEIEKSSSVQELRPVPITG